MSAMMLINFPARKHKAPYLKVPYFSNQPEAILNVSFSVEWQLNFIELKLNFIELKLNYGIEYCYNRLAIPNAVFFPFWFNIGFMQYDV